MSKISLFTHAVCIVWLLFSAPLSYAKDAQAPYGNKVSDAIYNYHRVSAQVASSGSIDEGGLKELKEHGFKTIIDLRTPPEGTQEERNAAEAEGLTYRNIPITGAGISAEQIAAFTKVFESAEKPVLFHCASGNRAGALWAYYQINKGTAHNLAIQQGRNIGMKPAWEDRIKACANGKC